MDAFVIRLIRLLTREFAYIQLEAIISHIYSIHFSLGELISFLQIQNVFFSEKHCHCLLTFMANFVSNSQKFIVSC